MKQYGMRKFEVLFDDITRDTFRKYGFVNTKILSQWADIVGVDLAKICWPEKITFEPGQTRAGMLHLCVSNPAFSLEIQSYQNRIIERIATFFGYQAVSRVKITVRPKKASEYKASQKQDVKIEEPRNEITSNSIESVQDEELRSVLKSLYNSL
jgi:hypothetical protein